MLQRVFNLFMMCLCGLLSTTAHAWFDNNWSYRAEIVVTEGGGVPLTDQQVEINLTAADLNADYVWSAAGNDLRAIASDDTTALDFFIESWDSIAQTARVWVKIPSLAANASTTIYLYHGNNAAASASNPTATLTEIGLRYHTRNSAFDPTNKTDAVNTFNALDDSVAGYGCTTVTNFTNIENSALFGGPNNNIAFFSNHHFEVTAATAGLWQFRFGGDYGRGGGLYVDDVALEEQWNDDLWWAFNFNNAAEVLEGSINLTAGYHTLQLIGYEGCCDGGTSVQFQNPTTGGWQTWSTANATIRSEKCLLTPTTEVLTPPVLTTSTKTFVDQNGGDILAGDVLRYTITLTETNNREAQRVRVVDNMPAEISNFTVVSTPAGSTNNSVALGGTNSTGLLDISEITVPANGSVTIVFDVTVTAVPNGTNINNSATITNSGGPINVTVNAPAAVVALNSLPGSGIKPLYLYNNLSLSRNQPGAAQPFIEINGANSSTTWTLTPAMQANLNIDTSSGVARVSLRLRERGPGNQRNIRLTLSGSASGQIGTLLQTYTLTTAFQVFDIDIPIGGGATSLVTGETITLVVINETPQNNRRIRVEPSNGTSHSQVQLPSNTVINVDSVEVYDAAYPGGSLVTTAYPGTTRHIRATVSDPFGSFDITSSNIVIIDPTPTTVVASTAMTEVQDSGVATKIYEYTYNVPAFPVTGFWTVQVTANEGSEGTVSDLGVGSFQVLQQPVLSVLKSASITSGNPGDVVTYTITVTNTGAGTATNVLLQDDMSPYSNIGVNTYGAGVVFQCSSGCPGSGITLGTPVYSNNNAASFVYAPSSTAGGAPAGFDGLVTDWRIPMTGTLNSGGASFSVQYQGQIK